MAKTARTCQCPDRPDVRIPLTWLVQRYQPERYNNWLKGEDWTVSDFIPGPATLANPPSAEELQLAAKMNKYASSIRPEQEGVVCTVPCSAQQSPNDRMSEGGSSQQTHNKQHRRRDTCCQKRKREKVTVGIYNFLTF